MNIILFTHLFLFSFESKAECFTQMQGLMKTSSFQSFADEV